MAACTGLPGVERENTPPRGVAGFLVPGPRSDAKKSLPPDLGCVDFIVGEALGVSPRTLILYQRSSAGTHHLEHQVVLILF